MTKITAKTKAALRSAAAILATAALACSPHTLLAKLGPLLAALSSKKKK